MPRRTHVHMQVADLAKGGGRSALTTTSVACVCSTTTLWKWHPCMFGFLMAEFLLCSLWLRLHDLATEHPGTQASIDYVVCYMFVTLAAVV
jgi:hypothetical protein